MPRLFALAAAAALGLTFAASAAQAGGCDEWGCGTNGTSLNGIWENGTLRQGVQVNGLPQQGEAMEPTVKAVILPSGETVVPR